MKKKMVILGALLAALSALMLLFHVFDRPRGFGGRKVLLICLDGATWHLMTPLMQKGELPNLSYLVKNGSSATMICDPAYSPPSWTSIATGKTAEKHGILNFSSTTTRTARYVWEILSDFNMKVAVAHWKMALAAKMNGPLYYNPWHARVKYEFYPPEVGEEVSKTLRLEPDPSFESVTSAQFLDIRDRNRMKIALYFVRKYRPVLLALGFDGSDILQHRFWNALEPHYFDISPEEIKEKKDLIPDYYRKIDRYLAYFIKNKWTIVFVSDHGFDRYDRFSGPVLSKYAYRNQDEQSINFLMDHLLETARLLEFTPGVRYPGRDHSGKIDFSKTRAYFYNEPARRHYGIRINEAVVPEAERPALREKIRRVLESVRFENNERIFLDVRDVSGEEGYGDIDIAFRVLPALNKENISFKATESFNHRLEVYHFKSQTGEKLTKVSVGDRVFDLDEFIDCALNGDHILEGVFIIWGEDVKKGVQLVDMKNYDVTPTILYLFGLPVAKDTDGRVLTEVFDPDFVAQHPLTYVTTYEKGPIEIYPQEIVVEEGRLRSLGYMQ